MKGENISLRMFHSPITINSEVCGSNPINSCGVFSTMTSDLKPNDKNIKSYKRRFWMLFLYVVLTTFTSTLFPLYVSEANVTGCYYDVSQTAVNWTLQVQMLVFVILVFPGTFLIEYLDLRLTLICASCLDVAACVIQFLSLKPQGFPYAMISSIFCAIAGVMIIGAAPYLAARWFPRNELSRACSFGNFGNIFGISIGTMLIPLMVSSDCEQKSLIEEGKRNLAYVLLAVHSVCLILILFTFQNSPQLPPSFLQLEKKEGKAITKKVLLSVLTNKDFLLILLMSGFLGSVFFSFTSNSNNLLIRFFPDQEQNISGITSLYIIMGIIGTICVGYILDYTHRFKETTIGFAFMTLVFYILFTSTLQLQKIWMPYIFASCFGFCNTAILPIALEYAIEVLFPVTEIICSNFIFWALETCGLILIEIVYQLLEHYGPISSCTVTAMVLVIAFISSCFLTKNYKRSGIFSENASSYVI